MNRSRIDQFRRSQIYTPPYEAHCTFPDCQCMYVCNTAVPRRPATAFPVWPLIAGVLVAVVFVGLWRIL